MTDPTNPPETGQTPSPPTEPPKTFTQEDVNRIVQERLAREQTRYADYDDLKAKATKLKEIENAELSETEKLRQQIEALTAEKSTWEAQDAARNLEIQDELLKAEIKAQASGFGIPWDVAYHLGDFEMEGDREKNVKKGLEQLAKDRPDLVIAGKGPGSPPNEPKGKPQSPEAVLDSFAEKYGTRIPPKKSGG